MVFRKKDPILETLYQISVNVYEAAKYFRSFDFQSAPEVDKFSVRMKEFESKGDTFIHEIITTLNKVFITALEREDILNLAVRLDDVLDGMEACAARFYMYDIHRVDEVMLQLAANIEESVSQILKSMELLRERKLMPMREFTVKINTLESEADEILRNGVRTLMQTSNDAIHIMKYKEIYEVLEGVSDSCEDVADMLETIIMRNS
jgi:predicted phosphate transport protein (TIGR00153 family)